MTESQLQQLLGIAAIHLVLFVVVQPDLVDEVDAKWAKVVKSIGAKAD